MGSSGVHSGRLWGVSIAAIVLVWTSGLSACSSRASAASATSSGEEQDVKIITVHVLNENNEEIKEGATVQVEGDPEQVDNDDDGGYYLQSCITSQTIVAKAPNYETGSVPCDASKVDYQISLKPAGSAAAPVSLPNITDDLNYSWLSATSCGGCHTDKQDSDHLEVREWQVSNLPRTSSNFFFRTMYLGTDSNGVSGPVTERTYVGGQLVRKLNLDATNYQGPGFQLDFPGQAGKCAFCHAPAAILASQAEIDLSPFSYVAGDARTESVTCEVCHKVNDVKLTADGYPFVDKPGLLSFDMLRMSDLTIGPLARIDLPSSGGTNHGQYTCSKIFSSSEFCAACHYGKFGDTLIYSSYVEWRQSTYSQNPEKNSAYRTCQDCHMSHLSDSDATPYEARQACSETVNGLKDLSHNMLDIGTDVKVGRDIPRMIRGAATLAANFQVDKNSRLRARVIVENIKAGHKFPTDSPLRHLILVVEATDPNGNPLMQVDGERIPNWGGVRGSYPEIQQVPAYAGLPGKIFANLLVESDINNAPTAAYWNETKPAFRNSDTRLLPNDPNNPNDRARDVSDYFFSVPDNGDVRFQISLIYRYGFYDLMQQKSWVNYPERWDIPVVILQCKGKVAQPQKIKCEQTEP